MYNRDKVLNLAKSWIGLKESDGSHMKIINIYNSQSPLPRGYKVKSTDAWCATFVSALSVYLGYQNIIPTECSCVYMIEGFKKLGSWVENDEYIPSPGDVIFYDWGDSGIGDNSGVADHVGLVESVENGNITVIEGNKNDSVSRRVIKINNKYIRGFGVPKYDTIVEIDIGLGSDYSKDAREWAIRSNLIKGTGNYNDKYDWYGVLTREQLVEVLYRYYQLNK